MTPVTGASPKYRPAPVARSAGRARAQAKSATSRQRSSSSRMSSVWMRRWFFSTASSKKRIAAQFTCSILRRLSK